MKKQQMTQEEYKKMKLNSNKHYLNSVLYVGGVYILESIKCLWFDLAEDELRKAGGLSFGFKHEFNAAKNAMNNFERTLRQYVVKKEEMCAEFELINARLEEILEDAGKQIKAYMDATIKDELQ